MFGEEAPCLSPEVQKIVKAYGDWYMTCDGVYIRISGSTKAPHWFPHFVPETLLLQKITYHTYVNGVVASLHKAKKGLWPHFPLSAGVHRIEKFKQVKEKLVFCPPSNSKRSLFEGMIPKENLKSICSRWDLHRVMLMNTYCLGNWSRSRCCWNPRFWTQTKWFKLIKKPRDKILKLRETKLPWSGRLFQASRTMKRIHHLHLCQCTTLILMGKIQNFYQTGLPLLSYIMLHFRRMWKKFTVHLSLNKLCLRGSLWSKKKIIPLVIISRKYLVLSLSTFTGMRSVGIELGKWSKVMELWRRCRKTKYYSIKLMKIMWQ